MISFFIILIVFLLGFLSGYLKGKNYGRSLGIYETETAIPLILRQNSLERGFCIICGQNAKSVCQDTQGFAGKNLSGEKL